MLSIYLPNVNWTKELTRSSVNVPLNRCLKVLLLGLLPILALAACQRGSYERPAGPINLGEVKHLLFEKQHIADKAVLLYRDEKGWAALSTRSTDKGCDLTYHEANFLDPCSNSLFSHTGKVLRGPAKEKLPWMELIYKDNRLFANPGKTVKASYRFTTDEIEKAIAKLRDELAESGVDQGVKIPKILLGQGDEPGSELDQFTDELEEVSDAEINRRTDATIKAY